MTGLLADLTRRHGTAITHRTSSGVQSGDVTVPGDAGRERGQAKQQLDHTPRHEWMFNRSGCTTE